MQSLHLPHVFHLLLANSKCPRILPFFHGKTIVRTTELLSADSIRLTPRTSTPEHIHALIKRAYGDCRNDGSLFALLSMLTPFHCITPIHHTSHEVPFPTTSSHGMPHRKARSLVVTHDAIRITQPKQPKKHGQFARTRSFGREADSHRVTLGGPTYVRLRPAVFPTFYTHLASARSRSSCPELPGAATARQDTEF